MSNVTTVNPSTGEEITTYEAHSDADLEILLGRAAAASTAWGRRTLSERIAVVNNLPTVLRSHKQEYAELITTEMGKVVSEAAGELEKSAVTAEYYATNAETLLGDQHVQIGGAKAWVAHEPMGLVLAVMPWNFPFWQAMRFAIPAVMAGNGVLLKHSPNVTGSALAIEQAFREAGLPEAVFTTLIVEESRVPEVTGRLIADDRVAAVTLTGSNRAGRAVGAAAGAAVKKSVLELGGSDAFVILADADIARAAEAAVKARFTNNGQSCVCAKRFIVEALVADEFTHQFVRLAKGLVVGDPTQDGINVGPMARDDLRTELQSQVDDSIAAGAKLVLGGAAVDGVGNFFQPTVLTDTRPGIRAFDEETFGPVAAIAVADDAEHAAALANSTEFGLGLSIWSADVERAVALARSITTGAVFVNSIVASDARLPFGGTKKSGYGRELADVGMHEFVNIRTYWVAE